MDTALAQTGLELLSYEDALSRLEAILSELEASDLPLEKALALYEQGTALAAYCTQKLEAAELRVRQWQANGETVALEGWQEK